MKIYIYIEGAGDEDDTELLLRPRPGFRSGIRSGKETTTGLRPGFIEFFQELLGLTHELRNNEPQRRRGHREIRV